MPKSAKKTEGVLANTVDRLINSVIDDDLAAGATVATKKRKSGKKPLAAKRAKKR